MTKQDFAIQFDRLASVFPCEVTVEKVSEYYVSLNGFSTARITRGVDHLIKNHAGYFPQPAQIIKAVYDSFIPTYNDKQIKYDFVELSDEEKLYRKLFVPYYLYLIQTNTRGFIVGFKNFSATPMFKYNSKHQEVKNMNKKRCIELIDKYCDSAIFNFDGVKNDL